MSVLATPTDGIKAILAGAHGVQMASAILRHGPTYFAAMRDGLMRWMESKHLSSIDEVRGRVNGRSGDAASWSGRTTSARCKAGPENATTSADLMSGADAAGAVHRFYRRIVWRVCAPATWVLWPALALACAGCGGQPAAPSPPPPDPATQVTPIDNTGPVRITFAAANIAPGSVVTGCGPAIEGCAGRMEMTFQLDPSFDGPVLSMRIYLHATNMIACLWGETPPFTVQGRVASTVRVPITNADRCGTPTTVATMAAVVEGPTQIGSRQTWSLHYVFAP